MVSVSTPGLHADDVHAPIEAVARSLPRESWAPAVLHDIERYDAVVVGPGLGNSPELIAEAAALVRSSPVPVVLDADGLRVLERDPRLALGAPSPIIVTPHDGEFTRLSGAAPSEDRLAAARGLAAALGVFVVLKGPTTVVAAPSGTARFVTSGNSRLATAGTGDVLAGVIGAVVRRDDVLDSVAAAAHWHGAAAAQGFEGLIASDLPALLPGARAAMVAG